MELVSQEPPASIRPQVASFLVHVLPVLVYPLEHEVQILAPLDVQAVPVALTPLVQVQTF